MKKLLCILSVLLQINFSFAQTNLAKFGFDGPVRAIKKDNLGNTYIGGDFSVVGLQSCGIPINSTFEPLSNYQKVHQSNSYYYYAVNASVSIPGGGWYIGGIFDLVGNENRKNLARINADGTLNGFNIEVDGDVRALYLDASNNLYIGGNFSSVNNEARTNFAIINADGSLNSFNPSVNNIVSDIAVDGNGNIFIVGEFTEVNGLPRTYFAKFNASKILTSFSPTIDNIVNTVELNSSNDIYIGGDFTTIDGNTRTKFAKYNSDESLNSFNPAFDNSVYTIKFDQSGNLFVGGLFTDVNSNTRLGLAKFDNSFNLTSLATNTIGVKTIEIDASNNLYLGGYFSTINSPYDRNGFAKYDALGNLDPLELKCGQNSFIHTISLDANNNLYVGGQVKLFKTEFRENLVKINSDGNLSSLNFDVSGGIGVGIYSIEIDDNNDIYIGGGFNSVLSGNRLNFAKINADGSLNSFAPNPNERVTDIKIDTDGNLYFSGWFTLVESSISRNKIVKYNNNGTLNSFSPFFNNNINRLVLDNNNNIYCAGQFNGVDGNSRDGICKFSNTGILQSFNANFNNGGRDLAINSLNEVFVTGGFSQVNGQNRNKIAKFDSNGNLLSDLNINPDNSGVTTIFIDHNDHLYLGGFFNQIGNEGRDRFAKIYPNGQLSNVSIVFSDLPMVFYEDSDGNIHIGTQSASAFSGYFVLNFPCSTTTVSSTTPASNCGTGNVTISASPSAGTISWYTSASGGTPITTSGNYTVTGNDLQIDNLSASTNFYAEAVNGSCVSEIRTLVAATVDNPITADAPSNVRACATYELPALSAGNNYYTGSGGTGTLLTAGTSITSTQTLYVYAVNGACTDENSFVVNIFDCIQLDAPSCNSTLTNLNDLIYSETAPGATQYRFKIEHAASGYSASTFQSGNSFRLTWINSNPVKYGTTYTVYSSAMVGGLWMPFDAGCTVTTPATQLNSSSCGAELSNLSDALYSEPVAGATNYRYEILNASDNSLVNVSTRGAANNLFRLSWVTGTSNNSTYLIRVTAFVEGSWQAYGPACTITTPVVSKLATGSCGANLPTMSTALYSEAVPGATNYRYEIRKQSDNSLVSISTRGSADNLFRMSWVSGVQLNTTYSIKVAVYVGGVWKSYGTACTVTTPAAMVLNESLQETEMTQTQLVGPESEFRVYPNPSSGHVKIHGEHAGVFELRNELGQLVQRIELPEAGEIEINLLVTGVYFIQDKTSGEIQKIIIQ